GALQCQLRLRQQLQAAGGGLQAEFAILRHELRGLARERQLEALAAMRALALEGKIHGPHRCLLAHPVSPGPGDRLLPVRCRTCAVRRRDALTRRPTLADTDASLDETPLSQ